MTDHSQQAARIESLLAQDAVISTFPFEESRMKLEQSIQELEQKARQIQRASYWGLAATILCMVSVLPMEALKLTQIAWIPPLWAVCGNIALWSTAILIYLNTHKYKPALERARSDLQTTMLVQLQQQVAELSRQLENRSEP